MTTSLWVAALVVLCAVAFDIKTRTIPNTVTLGGLFVGLAIHAATGVVSAGILGGARGVGEAAFGAFACSILPVLAWKRGEMGGGDVKLFAALGALLGSGVGFDIEAKTFVLAFLVLFPYRLLRHGGMRIALKNTAISARNVFFAKRPLVAGPKLPPVILAPTIGIAFVVSVIAHGALF